MDAAKPTFGFAPDSSLARYLSQPGMTRRLRRMTLSVVQSKNPRRQARLQRRVMRELAADQA